MKCPKGCCNIIVKTYVSIQNPFEKIRRRKHKAGVLIHDPSKDKILLIQSRGHLWGPPKGTIEFGESINNCAIREVKEETGLEVNSDSFTKTVNINNRAIYYYMHMPECDVTVQDHIQDNDANSISWIRLTCLAECIKAGNVCVTQHCRIVVYKLLGFKLPYRIES
jgi:ADP-ribose pyrophosphatase YjhB (NUDIX family)